MNIKTFILLLILSPLTLAGDIYTKVSSDGRSLADSAADWSCVKHNQSGQIWEVKKSLNQFEQYAFSELSQYVDNINQQRLCGYNDWRLPSVKELNSLVDNSQLLAWFNSHQHLTIDLNYFPNSQTRYWSGTLAANSQAWYVSFLWGGNHRQSQTQKSAIRLLRGAAYFDSFDYRKLDRTGNELAADARDWSCVKDNQSGLIWQVKSSANQNHLYTYAEIAAYVSEINRSALCGMTGWRVPDLDELESLVDYRGETPAISRDYFPYVGLYSENVFSTLTQYSAYWGQISEKLSADQSACVDFQTGQSCFKAKSESLLLRLVSKDTGALKEIPSQAAKQIVQKAYLAYYGRPGDPDGIDYWALRLDSAGGNWTNEIINAFGQSEEFNARFANLSDIQLISNIYLQLFNRNPEPAGLNFFLAQLDSQQASLAEIAVVILNGAQGDDSITLSNKLSICDYFTEKVRSGVLYGSIDTARTIVEGVSLDASSLTQAYTEIDQLN